MTGELSPAVLARTRRFARQLAERRLQSASPPRRPDSPPTASCNERVAPRTASSQTKTKTFTRLTSTQKRGEHHDRLTWCSACPYISPGLSLRPPSSSCGKLPEGRRYPCPTPRSYEPTNDERSPPCGAQEKQAEKSARHRYTFFFFMALLESLVPFPW